MNESLWSQVCESFPHDEYEGARMLANHIVDKIDDVLMAAQAGSVPAKEALRIIREAAHKAASEAE